MYIARMTKKDFKLVASAISSEINDWGAPRSESDIAALVALDEVALRLADVFAAANPKFNRKTFLKACGVDAA